MRRPTSFPSAQPATSLPFLSHRHGGPARQGLLPRRGRAGLCSESVAARATRPLLARTPRQPQPPLFKRRDLPWNPIDRKPPPLARANPSRHCCQARSSAPRRLRRSEGSPRGEDRPPPRNPSLSRVLGLRKAHRSLSSAGSRCAPCSGRLDPLPSIPSSL